MDHELVRSIIISIGIPLYPICVMLCAIAGYRFKDRLFFWQALHLAGLTGSTMFFAWWYANERIPLAYDMHFYLPNLFNLIMQIGAGMWCISAFRKRVR